MDATPLGVAGSLILTAPGLVVVAAGSLLLQALTRRAADRGRATLR